MRLQAYVYLGWSPRLAVVPNGTNQVLQVVGWDGGSGTAPATGLYVGSTGYVTNITDGVNIKGAAGGGGGAAQSFAGGNTFGNTFLANNGTVGWYAGNNISLSLDSLGQNATIIGNTPVVFSNANGVTFGTNAGTVTASVNTNYQSQGAYLTTAMLSNAGSNFAGLNSAITNGLMTYNSSGLSLNLSNLLTTAMQSNAGSNFVNTSQSSLFQQTSAMSNYLTTAMLSNAGSNFVGLNSAITGGSMTANSSGISINLPNYLTTAMASNASSVFAGTGTTFAGTNVSGSMTLNSNGLNLALSAGAGGGGGSINVSAGTTSNNLSAFTMSNANGVSFGLNGSVLTASVAAAGGAQTGISGISAGTTVLTSGTLSFGNSNGITFGLNGSVITGTVATNYQSQGAYLTTAMASNAATISNVNISAGTTSNNVSAFVFSNSNNVSFGLSNGSQVTASATFAQSVQPMYYSASGTSSSSGTIQFGNTQGVSFSLSNGSIVGSVATNYQSQGAYLTTAMVSNAGSNFVGLNTAITNGLMTANSSGISINLSNHLTTAMASNAGSNFIGLNTAITNGLMTANSSGISLNLSNLLTTAMASNAGSNFVGLNSAVTGASLTVNSSGISINVPAAAPSPVYVIAGTTNGSLGTISFANSNGVSFGLNGSTITASAAGGGGGGIALANSQTTYTSGTANLIASGALTVGSTTGQSFYISAPALSSLSATGILSLSTNGNTISIGAAYVTINDYQPYQLANSTYTSLANTTPIWLGIYPQENVSMSVIEMISSLSFSSYSSTWNKGYTLSYGMYSQNGASTSLMGSSSMAMLISASSSATFGITLSQGTNSTTYATANSSLSALTGQKIVQMPFSTSLAAGGNYFFGMISSSSSAGSNVAATVSYLANNAMTNASFGYLLPNALSASAASNVHEPFGFGYTAGTAAFPTTFQVSQMSIQSNLQPYVFFEN